MKPRIAAISFLFLFHSLVTIPSAESEEPRNKLQMTTSFGGKSIASDLLSIRTTISRYPDENFSLPEKDTALAKGKAGDEKRSSFYLSMMVKRMTPELLSLFAERQNRFDGTINITDTYGKNPTTTIAFKGAALETYSDQFSGASYNDSYSGSNLSVGCKFLSVNGVEIES